MRNWFLKKIKSGCSAEQDEWCWLKLHSWLKHLSSRDNVIIRSEIFVQTPYWRVITSYGRYFTVCRLHACLSNHQWWSQVAQKKAASNCVGGSMDTPATLKFCCVCIRFNAATAHHQEQARRGGQTQVRKEGLGSGSFDGFLDSLVSFHREQERGWVATNLWSVSFLSLIPTMDLYGTFNRSISKI